MWFPRLAAERSLRANPVDAPFALTLFDRNSERIHDLCPHAESFGLQRGMSLVHARSFCPGLLTRPANPEADQQFLRLLARWATRYCPWVGLDGRDGLYLDITGSAHLLGGEEPLLEDMRARLARAGLSARLGLAGTPGTAWALSHFAEGIAGPGENLARITPCRLPPCACPTRPAPAWSGSASLPFAIFTTCPGRPSPGATSRTCCAGSTRRSAAFRNRSRRSRTRRALPCA
ncbi:DNA polymerase Y family protein [Roseibium salinum]|nr:DNA polymerase Y family protein [Roseibium salinum]